MRRIGGSLLLPLALLLLLGCDEDVDPVDAGSTDSGTDPSDAGDDASVDPDAGDDDSGTDAGAPEAPVAVDDGYAGVEDVTLDVSATEGVLANDSDPEGATLTAEVSTMPAEGALTLNADGSFQYVPNADFNGSDSFEYVALAGGRRSSPATVTIDLRIAYDAAWAVRAGAAVNDNAWSVYVLADGSSVVTGSFRGAAVFGPGDSTETTLTSATAGADDIFVARYDADGTLAWARRAGGTGLDYATGVAAIADGSVFVTGAFSGTATFGPGELGETILLGTSGPEIFVARYASNGDLVWAKGATGSGFDQSNAIAVMADGTSLIAGQVRNTTTFGAGETTETTLTAGATAYDIFVARYAPDGSFGWAVAAGGGGDDAASGIAVASDGSAYVTGRIGDAAVFGAGETGETTVTFGDSRNMFLARFASDGTLGWVTDAGGSSEDVGYDVELFADGTLAVCGYYNGSATFGAGETGEATLSGVSSREAFFARYASDGALRWVRGLASDRSNTAYGVVTMADGSVLATGGFGGTVTLGAGEPAETTLGPTGGSDVFVVHLEADGALRWATSAGGTGGDEGHGISANAAGAIVVVGEFGRTTDGAATFGAGEPGETVLSTAGGTDVFVAGWD